MPLAVLSSFNHAFCATDAQSIAQIKKTCAAFAGKQKNPNPELIKSIDDSTVLKQLTMRKGKVDMEQLLFRTPKETFAFLMAVLCKLVSAVQWLAELHDFMLIHRDLKLSNVVVSKSYKISAWTLALIDFGGTIAMTDDTMHLAMDSVMERAVATAQYVYTPIECFILKESKVKMSDQYAAVREYLVQKCHGNEAALHLVHIFTTETVPTGKLTYELSPQAYNVYQLGLILIETCILIAIRKPEPKEFNILTKLAYLAATMCVNEPQKRPACDDIYNNMWDIFEAESVSIADAIYEIIKKFKSPGEYYKAVSAPDAHDEVSASGAPASKKRSRAQ